MRSREVMDKHAVPEKDREKLLASTIGELNKLEFDTSYLPAWEWALLQNDVPVKSQLLCLQIVSRIDDPGSSEVLAEVLRAARTDETRGVPALVDLATLEMCQHASTATLDVIAEELKGTGRHRKTVLVVACSNLVRSAEWEALIQDEANAVAVQEISAACEGHGLPIRGRAESE